MEEVMPMEIVKNNFKANVLRLKLFFKREFVYFYEALTSYGNMTLIVEEFFSSINRETELKNLRIVQFKAIETRNKLLKSQEIVSPLIYEQQIKKVRENYFICLTLTQPIIISQRTDLLQSNEITKYENLVECTFKIQNTQFQYEAESYHLETYITSTYTDRAFMDFTKIEKAKNKNQETEKYQSSTFINFKKALCEIISAPRPGKISEIIFIKERSSLLNPETLLEAKNWVDLALMFNLLQNQKVVVLSDKKQKTTPICKLHGHVTIEYKGIKYQNLNFEEGYRLDGFQELNYEQLKNLFFQDKITYFMSKQRYQTVKKRYNSEQCWIRNNIQFTDLIIVKSSITKAQFISFLIGYFKYSDPSISVVRYIFEQNALQLQFVNRFKKTKSVLMKFSPKYLVRDEQISMIIEKGRLKNTCIDIKKMPITDSCLMYLANCDKMLNITSLDISYCPHVTDSGVQLLFASPLCKKLKTLKMSGLVCPDFTVVKFRKELQELQINNCQHYGQEFSVGDWKLQKISALGVHVNLSLPMTLKSLSLDQDVMIENLKYLKNLSLTSLKIKLVENKKNISTFFNTLTKKDNPVRVFCQGNSRKTLKNLDISHCTVKLKELKSLLMIETLQTLICQGIQRVNLGDITLPQNITQISLKNTHITIQQLTQLLCRTSILIKLNLCYTGIDECSLQNFVRSKKYINDLQLNEEQFDYKMLQKRNGVETLHIHLHKLIRDEHQLILNKILLTQAETGKQLNFVCDHKIEEKVIAKIHRFTMFYQNHLSKMLSSNLNIFVNSIPLWKLISYHFKQNHQEHINILTQHSHHHKIRVQPSQVLSETVLRHREIHLETFNIFLHKTLTMYRYPLLQVCIRSNRVLGKQVIGLLQKYAGNVLKAIDFRQCVFGFQEVKQDLFQFPMLQCVNEGQYEIEVNQQDVCQIQLQKLLKFFMKLTHNQKIKLSIKANSVQERQLFYSIMYEILHQYKEQIIHLSIDFQNMRVDNSQIFWIEVFSISCLEVLKLYYFNDIFKQQEISILSHEFKNLSNHILYSLQISSNAPNFLTQNLSSLELKRLYLDFPGSLLNEASLMKLLKNVTTLKHLDLRIPENESLVSLKKLSDVIEKMEDLTYLSLNIQNCSAKQNSIYQFLYCLQKNKHLERIELNINNLYVNIPDLAKFCEVLQKQNKFLHIVIYSTQMKRQSFTRDQNELIAKGIEIIHGPSLQFKKE